MDTDRSLLYHLYKDEIAVIKIQDNAEKRNKYIKELDKYARYPQSIIFMHISKNQ